jgi:DNA-binding transcriptional MerR regulator
MEYTVKQLGNMAGISSRTLRYYDEIGLLKPALINSSGYRIYTQVEVDQLQQILFYRELGVSLCQIKEIITAPSFDGLQALRDHREKLLAKRQRLDQLILNVEKTITTQERGIEMEDQEKFEGFKEKLIADNEKKYGKEIRTKYGDEVIDLSNNTMKGMTREQYARWEQLSSTIIGTLIKAMETGDPASGLAQETAELHRQWISFSWGNYNKEAHAGLVQMYVDDERFRAYYDRHKPGAAQFLRDAVLIYTGRK